MKQSIEEAAKEYAENEAERIYGDLRGMHVIGKYTAEETLTQVMGAYKKGVKDGAEWQAKQSTPVAVEKSAEDLNRQIKEIISNVRVFIPKHTSIDDPKQLAMYNVFHSLESLAVDLREYAQQFKPVAPVQVGIKDVVKVLNNHSDFITDKDQAIDDFKYNDLASDILKLFSVAPIQDDKK